MKNEKLMAEEVRGIPYPVAVLAREAVLACLPDIKDNEKLHLLYQTVAERLADAISHTEYQFSLHNKEITGEELNQHLQILDWLKEQNSPDEVEK
jgi:hypothetical protein